MIMLTDQQLAEYRQTYENQGYALVRGFFRPEDLKPYQDAYLRMVQEKTGRAFTSMHDPELRDLFNQDRKLESEVYTAVRDLPEMLALASDGRMAEVLEQIVPGHDWRLLEKMIMRIDMPEWTEEIAHWHQDHFYVKGNTEIVTVWIPLQNVFHENGCLLVAPRSHKMGVVEHSHMIGKRHTPEEDLLQRLDTTEVPMQFGDILLFNALLFHAGQLNTSDHIRYSFQFRYTPAGMPTDASMGRVLEMRRSALS
jgi:ectoine hydroxylase-related dioxygenase (phytanoyl-CoA dioxygenase family)